MLCGMHVMLLDTGHYLVDVKYTHQWTESWDQKADHEPASPSARPRNLPKSLWLYWDVLTSLYEDLRDDPTLTIATTCRDGTRDSRCAAIVSMQSFRLPSVRMHGARGAEFLCFRCCGGDTFELVETTAIL